MSEPASSSSKSNAGLIAAVAGLVVAALAALWFMRTSPESQLGPEPSEAVDLDKELAKRKRAARGEQPEREIVALTGTVKDARDGKGIEGATVFLNRRAFNQGVVREPGRPAEPLYAVTDAKGQYRIEGVPSGRYAVSATAKNYAPATQKNYVIRGDGEQNLVLELQTGGLELSGAITDVGGGPIEGVLVRVDSMEGPNFAGMNRAPLAAVSDENGEYVTYLKEGRYVITTYHPDYVGVFRMTQMEGGPRRENLELIPAASIEGVVLNRADKKPVANASVTFSDARNGQAGMGFRSNFSVDGRQVLTDDQGRFALTGLYSGVVKVDARAPHFAAREPVEVQVGIGETVTDVEVLVDSAFKVSGFVVPKDDKEGAIADVLVGAYTLKPFMLIASSQPSDDDGYFEIHGLEPGAYTIGALSEEALPTIAGVGITVEDKDIDDVVLALDRGVHVKGRVTPPESAQVDVTMDMKNMGFGNMFDAVAAAFAGKRTGDDGVFDVGPLKPGKYKLVAKASSGAAAEMEIEVPAEGLENVELVLEPKASLQGFVRDTSGQPMAGVNVDLVNVEGGSIDMAVAMRGGGMGSGFATGEDGSFLARGYDGGEYMVSVTDRRGRRMELSLPEGEEELRVELAPAQAMANFDIVVSSTDGEISGQVLDSEGLPVADAWVRASRDMDQREFGEMMGPARPKKQKAERREGVRPPRDDEGDDDFTVPEYFAEPPVLTDASGSFLIKNLKPDETYVVVAEGERGGAKVRESGVKPGDTLTLTLAQLGTLQGKALLGGSPAKEYSVTLKGPNPRSKRVREADGAFSFERLEAGSYEVKVESDEGTGKAEVEIESGKQASIDIEIEGFATLEGTLVNAADGKPMAKMLALVIPDDGDFDPSQIMAMMTGMGGARTDGDGEFTIKKVKEGKGQIVFMDPKGDLMSGAGAVASVPYEVEAGDEVDLGEVNGVAPSGIDADERGELGIDTTSANFAKRPRPPGTDLDAEEEDPQDEDPRERLWVLWVEVGGPADEAGLEPGDEIMAIDGKPVSAIGARASELSLSSSRLRAGQSLEIQIDRQGSTSTKTVEARAKADD